MTQEELFAPISLDKLDIFTREELVILYRGEQDLRIKMQKEVSRLQSLHDELKQKSMFVNEQLITIKGKLFGKSSDRPNRAAKDKKSKDQKKKKVQLPSQRYPNTPVIEKHVTLDHLPSCKCCGAEMEDSGMTEDSEYLTKVPAQYYIVVQMRHKYRCGKCHGDIQTAPGMLRITPGGSYSDELVVDVAVSKYCDLIPIERFAAMAGREGLSELPPQSLIEGTHRLADFVDRAYERLKNEMLASSIWHADETPHRMLEGDKNKRWYLWGFSTPTTSYFECHDTRSGDVAGMLFLKSNCRFLVSDIFSGYVKSVREANKARAEEPDELKRLPQILHVYCNAHALRKFGEACDIYYQLMEREKDPEAKARLRVEYERAKYCLDQYDDIYDLEKLAKGQPPDEVRRLRQKMTPHFENIKTKCLADVGGYSDRSAMGKAMNYFLKNYEGFTRFTDHPELPIDNNLQEGLLRNPVIGRKTWLGTHSRRGAKTSVVLFSLVESCKLNKVNPREYFKNLVQDLHLGKEAYTPKEYKDLLKH